MKSIMKRMLIVSMCIVLFSFISLITIAEQDAPFHIGIMTGGLEQQEDAYRGARMLIEKYGEVRDGGMINHLISPFAFMTEIETTISQIVSFADDPKTKAIVMNEAIPGAVEGFRRVRELRPDIILFAGNPQEDPVMIAEVADLSVVPDEFSVGYLLPLAAKTLGADTFVHISFPRHMSYELYSRRRDIMAEASKDLGLKFVDVGAPDPVSQDVGVAGAQMFLLEKVPAWVEEYGKNTNFFSSNYAHEEPIIRRVAELGAFYALGAGASPTMGYPGALGISFEEEDKGNWPNIVKKVEEKVVELDASGRMGCWAFPINYLLGVALGEHAIRTVEGTSELLDTSDILDAFKEYSPGAEWASRYYVDAYDIERENFLMIYQDIYIFGKGYLNMTSVEIPEKYYDKDIGKK